MDILRKYERLKAEYKINKKQLKEKNNRYSIINKNIISHNEAIDILTEAGKYIHEDIVKKIESIVTLTIRHVYNRDFEFKLIYETKRNNVEARPVILEDGNEFDIKDELGGGLIDISSFAMRIALWSIKNPKTRNLFFLDEPFKWCGSYIDKAGEMLKYLSKELNLQVIMISHDHSLIDICDKVYLVNHDGRKSIVTSNRILKRRK